MSLSVGTLVQTECEPVDVSLKGKLAFLKHGLPWPSEAPPECIETHASYVFLTRERAWKLKKPVRLLHIDQRTLAARAHLCREEVRLNRELAGSVYRGVVPLVERPDGGLALVVKLPDSAGSQGNFVLPSHPIRGLAPRRLRDQLLKRLSLAGGEIRFPMLVEVWDDYVVADPSVQMWIPRSTAGLPVMEGIFEQVLSGEQAAFAGAAPADLAQPIEDALYRDAFRLAVLF